MLFHRNKVHNYGFFNFLLVHHILGRFTITNSWHEWKSEIIETSNIINSLACLQVREAGFVGGENINVQERPGLLNTASQSSCWLMLSVRRLPISTEWQRFINIFGRRETGFHRQAKCFELNFSIRKTFL